MFVPSGSGASLMVKEGMAKPASLLKPGRMSQSCCYGEQGQKRCAVEGIIYGMYL